jgi:hypothetical protein
MLKSEEGVSNNGMSWSHKSVLWLVAVVALITAGLLVYSQTGAFTADEGFHILTAHLIRSGKRPYLDFVFPHTPLNAYLNAAWMGIFGESWRAVHVLAAFETAGAVLLSAWFVFARFPVPGWRLPGAITVALLAGANMLVVDFGPIAQAYGICLFLTVAAFCVSVVLVERKSFLLPALAGLLAGAAAACSLLAASTSWVLLVWIFLYNRVGNRFVKSGAFILGAIVSFAPVLRLFVQGPSQVWFNIFQYHFFYREINWPGARRHNFEVLTSWINNSQGLCLVLLGPRRRIVSRGDGAGIVGRRRRKRIPRIQGRAKGLLNKAVEKTIATSDTVTHLRCLVPCFSSRVSFRWDQLVRDC